jgi:hypothetical protein
MIAFAFILGSVSQEPSQPAWLNHRGADHLFYASGAYNWSIYRIPEFARDMFATGVGHAMAYEALVTGRSSQLETKVFGQINAVLQNPPRKPVDERALSPTFNRQYGSLEKVFDWAHTLHFQTIDVLSYPGLNDVQKERKIEELWQFYSRQPYAITGMPMNMEYLDSMPYSMAFRKQYPKVNGLFWGYHWLQTANYDMLYQVPVRDQKPQYDVLGDQYRRVELYKTDRDFMPMTAELSPRFALRFPHIANAFDNLHMLHDNVNDILASSLSSVNKRSEVNRAIVRMLASSHVGEKPGERMSQGLHDHRHPPSTPGMGFMRGSDEDEMFMTGMGWMDMGVCAHCSIRLPENNPWGATVTAEGWTMQVRCLMCARDMASETPGRAIIRARTNDPNRMLVLISDEEGNWQTNIAEVVFLEKFGEHPECNGWSRAFVNQAAFDIYVRENPDYAGTKPLSLTEWAKLNMGRPLTYEKIDRPNPYRGGSL